MSDYLETVAVCRLLDVSPVSLFKWREQPGIGPKWIKDGHRYKYPLADFQSYLEELTGGGPVPQGLTVDAKRKMFAKVHRPAPPVDKAPPPEMAPSRAELAVRIENLEARLAKVELSKAKRRKAVKRRRRMLSGLSDREIAAARKRSRGRPVPTPPATKELHTLIMSHVTATPCRLSVASAREVLAHFKVGRVTDLTDEQAVKGKAMVEKMVEASRKWPLVKEAVMRLDPNVDRHWVMTGAHKGQP